MRTVSCLRLAMLLALFFVSACLARAQTISAPPQNQTVAVGETVTFGVFATGAPSPTYQWLKNGAVLSGATGVTLTIVSAQPADAGIYTVLVASGANTVSVSAILALGPSGKIAGAAREVGSNIVHPSGNIYDQILLEGSAATITADPGQVTRISYVALNDDIVQLEFAGAGALTVVLDSPTGPATPVKYNQPTVSYMKGHARIVIGGANETTNVSVFSVGRANAVNQTLFKSDVTYDGLADVAFLAVTSANGKFGGIRTANASYFATRGLTGVYAPDVQFTGPVFLGDITAYDAAAPVLVLGFATDVRITGGDLLQANAQPVQVGGFAQLKFSNGSTSHGVLLAAQPVRGVLVQGGTDVTNQLSGAKANAALYLARLRPESFSSTSLASGYATIAIKADGTAAVSMSFSNLSSPETSAYLRLGSGGDYVLALGLGQVSDRPWDFAPTGNNATTDLIYALNNGNLYVSLNSAKFPDGELRGNFVVATGSQVFIAPPAPPALPASALATPTQTDAARFLTQATFGPTTAGITALMARGINGWIDDQIALSPSLHLAGIREDAALFPNPPTPPTLTYEKFYNWTRSVAWWKIAITGQDQLRQRVAFALSEIFVVSSVSIGDKPEGLANYYDLLVKGSFGNFRQLLEDVSLSPVMGTYLSHLKNQKADLVKGTSPDENYAREIQQLFTIGLVQLQPDGTLLLDAAGQPIPTYDQSMIGETAKILTGWSFAIQGGTNFFGSPVDMRATGFDNTSGWLQPMRHFDAFHDKAAKKIVSLQQVPLAQATPTNVAGGQTGPNDLKALLDTLFLHPNTGPFLCKQLIQRLVTSNPSPGYVYRVAGVFANDGTGTRGNLAAVVRAILTDHEARSPSVMANAGYGKLKEPLVRVTGFMRACKGSAANGRFLDSYVTDPRTPSGYNPNGPFFHPVGGFNQGPLDAPSVFNFFAPDYSPPGPLAAAGLVMPEMQITDATYALLVPNYMLNYLFRTAPPVANAPTPSPFIFMDLAEFLPNAKNTNALLDQLNLLFCANGMSPATRSRVAAAHQLIVANTNSNDPDRVRTAIQLVLTSPDCAVQR